jgi:hypothetical protein
MRLRHDWLPGLPRVIGCESGNTKTFAPNHFLAGEVQRTRKNFRRANGLVCRNITRSRWG